MSSQSQLIEICRYALADTCPVQYSWKDERILEFINRALHSVYPVLKRVVCNDEIRLMYDTLTYDLSTLQPPVEGLIGVYIVTNLKEYFVRRHYAWDATVKRLTFDATFYHSILRETYTTSQTGEKLHVMYTSWFSPLDDNNQECELNAPDEEVLVLKVQELALRQLRNVMIRGRERLPTETWNEFDRIISSCETSYERLLNRKATRAHGGYPSTRRRLVRTRRVRSY